MTVTILNGDCRDVLRTLPTESVHCVVTSPPYWGLRDYGIAGQLGLESHLGDHIAVMVEVFREVHRVLRSDGTLWLNYGDSYATSVNGRSAADTKAAGNDDRTFRDKPFSTIGPVARDGAAMLKPKDLCGIPWRVAFALQADGWYLRQDIIWSKPNPMPESVRDRCTKSHEYLFLLSKAERYHYDGEAISEVCSNKTQWTYAQPDKAARAGITSNGTGKSTMRVEPDDGKRNRRSVWEIATQPFPEAHFATFPPALIEPCILAGCPKECCAKCGAPWVRREETIRQSSWKDRKQCGHVGGLGSVALQIAHGASHDFDNRAGGFGSPSIKKTVGFFPSCSCNAGTVGGTVLDPFGGAGTTGLVADRLGRNAILIEINPEYAAMAERRIRDDAGMFASVNHAPTDAYDGQADLGGSIRDGFAAIRERKANGGPGWEPKG